MPVAEQVIADSFAVHYCSGPRVTRTKTAKGR